MEDLKNLSLAITRLDKSAKSLLSTCVNLCKYQLKNLDDSDVIEGVLLVYPKENADDIAKIARALVLDMTINAEQVIKELPNFISKTRDGFSFNVKSGFLAQVWCGDMYDITGVQALNHLATEFDDLQKKANAKNLIQQIVQAMEK